MHSPYGSPQTDRNANRSRTRSRIAERIGIALECQDKLKHVIEVDDVVRHHGVNVGQLSGGIAMDTTRPLALSIQLQISFRMGYSASGNQVSHARVSCAPHSVSSGFQPGTAKDT